MITRAIIRTGHDRWTAFEEPCDTVVVPAATEPRDMPVALPAALDRVESLVESTGLPAVGFLTYEAACAFGLDTHPPGDLPHLCFVLFRHSRDATEDFAGPPPRGAGYSVGPWRNSLDTATYEARIEQIRYHLEAGNTYQVNFTFPMDAPFSGDSFACFRDLCAAQNGAYAAYLELDGGHTILSASPELFIEREGTHLASLPMKGTAPRGLTTEEDRRISETLARSPKERAENLMITDMIRNDLGRIAVPGSVHVPRLFSVEIFPRVLQMVSRVEARSDASLKDLLTAVFPCASITGAPKKRTMEIIRELEDGPRGIYTGTIGVLYPNRRMRFNVAIRTVVVDRSRNHARFGVGGGIVWDSDTSREFEECATKATVLAVPDPPVTLLETVRWSPAEGIYLYDGHRRRLLDSARYFNISLNAPDHRDLLDHDRLHGRIAACAAASPEEWRVRLLVDAQGMEVQAEPLPSLHLGSTLPCRTVALSPDPIPDRCLWVRHKTTNRAVYEERRRPFPEADDVLLYNRAGNLTESCYASILVERPARDGAGPYLATPPVSDGLLPGVFRQTLLDSHGDTVPWTPGNLPVREESIPLTALEEVRRGDASLYLVNSVRGWMRADLRSAILDLAARSRSILR